MNVNVTIIVIGTMIKYYHLNPKVLRTHLGAFQYFSCHGDWYRELVIGVTQVKMWSFYQNCDEKLDISDCAEISRHQFHLQLHKHILINNQMTLQDLFQIYNDLEQSFIAPRWEVQVKYNKLQVYKDKLSTIIENLQLEGNKTTDAVAILKIKDDLELANRLLNVTHYEFKGLVK